MSTKIPYRNQEIGQQKDSEPADGTIVFPKRFQGLSLLYGNQHPSENAKGKVDASKAWYQQDRRGCRQHASDCGNAEGILRRSLLAVFCRRFHGCFSGSCRQLRWKWGADERAE
jgi:hypothetical protein